MSSAADEARGASHAWTRSAMVLGVLMVAIVGGAVGWGFARGGGMAAVRELMQAPWFVVSLIDVYAGFILVVGWIAIREPAWWRTILWGVLVLTLGNVITGVYLIAAAAGASGDLRRFMLGARARS
ncbi:MAG: DUF1475 family protein [Phycisphaerales bacterium]